MIIHFRRPIPRHRDFFRHQTQPPGAAVWHPESGMLHFGVVLPVAAFVFPIAVVAVTAGFDEPEEFMVADQVTTDLERRYFGFMAAVFVVPTVGWIRCRLAQPYRTGGDVDDIVVRRVATDLAGQPFRVRLHVMQ